MCPHGLGIGHLVYDIALAIPFVASAVLGLKYYLYRIKKGRNNG